jgi:hypothetical protein
MDTITCQNNKPQKSEKLKFRNCTLKLDNLSLVKLNSSYSDRNLLLSPADAIQRKKKFKLISNASMAHKIHSFKEEISLKIKKIEKDQIEINDYILKSKKIQSTKNNLNDLLNSISGFKANKQKKSVIRLQGKGKKDQYNNATLFSSSKNGKTKEIMFNANTTTNSRSQYLSVLNPKLNIKSYKLIRSKLIQPISSNKPLKNFNEDILKDSKPTSCKARLSKLKKDFNENFSILDINKSLLLNYSRFSILLESMGFIENPFKKTAEERALILAGWKLAGGSESKHVSKNSCYALCLSIMNISNKSTKSNKPNSPRAVTNPAPPSTKNEALGIHQKFLKFYKNRENFCNSGSPESRNILQKNLSYEEKDYIYNSFLKDSCSNLRQNNSAKVSKSMSNDPPKTEPGPQINEVQSDIPDSSKVPVDPLSIKINENDASFFSENNFKNSCSPRLSLRLSSQIFGRPQKDLNIKRNNRRSTTSSYESRLKSKPSFDISLDHEADEVILSVKLPLGDKQIAVLNKNEFNESVSDTLIDKFQIPEEYEKAFKEKITQSLAKNV